MTPTNENGLDGAGWAVLAAAGAVILAFAKKLDPRLILAWFNEPTMKPIHDRLDSLDHKWDKVCRVIDKIPGAEQAHAAIHGEDEERRKRWAA